MLSALLAIVVVALVIALVDKNATLAKLHTDLTAVELKVEGDVKSVLGTILADLKKHI